MKLIVGIAPLNGTIDIVNQKPARDRAVIWSLVAVTLATVAFVAACVNLILN